MRDFRRISTFLISMYFISLNHLFKMALRFSFRTLARSYLANSNYCAYASSDGWSISRACSSDDDAPSSSSPVNSAEGSPTRFSSNCRSPGADSTDCSFTLGRLSCSMLRRSAFEAFGSVKFYGRAATKSGGFYSVFYPPSLLLNL